MSAPVIPVPAAPPAPPAPPSPNPPPAPSPISGAPPAPPPAPSPYAGLSDADKDRMLTFYIGAARAQEGRINELVGRVDALSAPKDPTPASPDSKALNQAFYEKPFETVRDVVRREVSEAIAPLKEFTSSFAAGNELDRLKMELKADPRLAAVFQIGEAHIDQLVRNALNGGAKLTRELIMGAVSSVKGGIDLGWISAGPLAPPGAPAPAGGPAPEPIIPPHLRPSAPPAPGPGDVKPKLRDLTEEEARLARENKLTPEEYLRALDMPAGQVANPEAWKARP